MSIFLKRYGDLLLVILIVAAGAYLFVSHPSAPAATYPELAEIERHQDWTFQDFSSYFQKVASAQGAPYAFEVLLRAPIPEGTDSHLLGHVIGGVLYKQEGINGIKWCTQDLRNACSHAIVIGVLLEYGENALSEITDACKKAPGGSGAYTMCFHGLGHGVLAYTGYNLEKAVAMCRKTGTPEYRYREYIECVGGTIMEMIDGVHDRTAWEREVKNYFKADDPLYPCDAAFMPQEARGICYTYLTPHFFAAAGLNEETLASSDFSTAFSYCSALPSASDVRDACYGGFGKEFIVVVEGRDVRDIGSMQAPALKRIREWCTQAHDQAGEIACNTSALASLFWGGENIPDASFTFCAIADSADARARCYDTLAQQIPQYLSGTLKSIQLCARLPEAYQERCRR